MKFAMLLLIFGLTLEVAHADQVQDTKAKLQKDLETGFQNLKQQVAELQQKMKHTSGQVQKDMQNQMQSLEKDQKEAEAKLKKLRNSSGEAWEDVKGGAYNAYEKFSQSVSVAKRRFQDETKKK